MKTPRKRLETRVQSILESLDELANLSASIEVTKPESLKIRQAVSEKLNSALHALETGKHKIDFKL